jgi:hypothetical protein
MTDDIVQELRSIRMEERPRNSSLEAAKSADAEGAFVLPKGKTSVRGEDGQDMSPPEVEEPYVYERRSRSGSESSVSSFVTVHSVVSSLRHTRVLGGQLIELQDTELARKLRKDFVPVQVSGPDVGGKFRKNAKGLTSLAFLDNGSASNFISESLCNKLRVVPSGLSDTSKQYLGPSGEPLKATGEIQLLVCWQRGIKSEGAKITFKVIVDLTFDIIVTFEMAKTTGMDLVAGPHPENETFNTVAPISSTVFHKMGVADDTDFKAKKRLENQKADNNKDFSLKSLNLKPNQSISRTPKPN